MKTRTRLLLCAVAAGMLSGILSCTQLTLPEGPTEVALDTTLGGYPNIQAMINASLDKALAAVDAAAARSAERDSRYATLSRALKRERDGNWATERVLNPDSSDGVTDEEQQEISSLMADDPALAADFAALADDLEDEYAAIPTIEVKVQRYDDNDNPIGEPHTIRSDDGMIEMGYQTLTSQEFLLWIQSNEHQSQRGFAAGSNYECYGRFLASLCRYSFWPRAIVFYFFDPALSGTEKKWMRAAIARMATGTGMTLVEVSTNRGDNTSLVYQHARGTSPYLKISKRAMFFSDEATVGRVKYSVLNMNSADVTDESTFNHEMGHVFGLLHEHQREDRNAHIEVSGLLTGVTSHDNLDEILTISRRPWATGSR